MAASASEERPLGEGWYDVDDAKQDAAGGSAEEAQPAASAAPAAAQSADRPALGEGWYDPDDAAHDIHGTQPEVGTPR